jgi:WD40 repeat protein/energy-coupling factor transporter ATP-binding protein EcfA2
MNRVFISYSRRNRTFTERLARDLSDAGLDVWVDFRQIHAGEMWEEEIYRGLERASIVILCLSPDAVTSDWVQKEISLAREQKKFILPVMAVNALDTLAQVEVMAWLLQIQYIDFEGLGYESAFPELLKALPGKRRLSSYDHVDDANIPNPFKGLEAFQQTDSAFFFGRDSLIEKSLDRLKQTRKTRFLAVVGASGSGKSSLVRAGILPAIRAGKLPSSETWRIAIFTPGDRPITALAQRLSPFIEGRDANELDHILHHQPSIFPDVIDEVLEDAPPEARLILVVDQFEEVFTRSGEVEAENFLNIIRHAITAEDGRVHVLITMRADFFDRLTRYPMLAELFEQENMVIVTDMTADELLRTIEGPADAVGLTYEKGLPQRILDEVRRQPGSLPLLQYALKELFQHREGRQLTIRAYNQIGGVQKALAQHAEKIYAELGRAQQVIMRRLLLRLVEVGETGEATRRRITYDDLLLRDIPEDVVQDLLDKLTDSNTRLLIANRQITARGDNERPVIYYEVGHEALIREWTRFREWITDNLENLRLGSEILQSANDWQSSNYDTAYLLTGTRLSRAETWLDEEDATPLQREFIQVSISETQRQENLDRNRIERELALQRTAGNRLRLTLAVVIGALVMAIVLAGWAILSQQETEQQRIVAENAEQRALANLRRAISLSLSAIANRELDSSNTLQAAKLAVNAVLIEQDHNNISEISERSLADVIYRPGVRHILNNAHTRPANLVLDKSGLLGFGTSGTSIVIWNIATGEEIGQWDGDETHNHQGLIRSLLYNEAREWVISGDSEGKIIIWDALTGEPLHQLTNDSTGAIESMDISQAGETLIASQDSYIVVWNTNIQEVKFVLSGFISPAVIYNIAINPAGNAIAGMSGNDIIIWRLSPNMIQRQYSLTTQDGTAHEQGVTALQFIPNSNLLVSGDAGGGVIVWNYSLNRLLERFTINMGGIKRIIYNPSNHSVIASDNLGMISSWSLNTPRRLLYQMRDHSGSVRSLAINANANVLVSTDVNGNGYVWDITNLADGDILSIGQPQNTFTSYSHDGSEILLYTSNRIMIVDATTYETVQQWSNVAHGIDSVMFSADSSQLFVFHRNQTASRLNRLTDTWRPILADMNTIYNESNPPTDILVFPDDDHVVMGDYEGKITIWSAERDSLLTLIPPKTDKDAIGHEYGMIQLAAHPDGKTFFSASEDGTLILWDLATGQAWGVYEGHNNEAVTAITFHPSGNYALSGAFDGRLILWDTSAGYETRSPRQALLKRFDAHPFMISDIAFSPVREQFATISLDRRLVIWDIRNIIRPITPQSSMQLLAQQSPDSAQAFDMRVFELIGDNNYTNIVFSPDGRKILSGQNREIARVRQIFPFPSDLLTYVANHRHVEPLSNAEIELYQIGSLSEWGSVESYRYTPTPSPIDD